MFALAQRVLLAVKGGVVVPPTGAAMDFSDANSSGFNYHFGVM